MKTENNFNIEQQSNEEERFINEKITWLKYVYNQEARLNNLSGHGFGLRRPDYERRSDDAFEESQNINFPASTIFELNGTNYTFEVDKGVFNPEFFSISKRVAADFPYQELKDKSILEFGPGIGAQMVLLGLNGAKKVVGIESNTKSVENSQKNIKKYNLEDTVEIRKGNMFSSLKENEKFASIYFHSPYFFKNEVNGDLNSALYDQDYEALIRFIYLGKKYLEPEGNLLLLYSDTINMDLMSTIIKDADMTEEIIKRYKSKSRMEPLGFIFSKIYPNN
ncbi:methyltransferase [Candidatus Falkowbacteria bacterium]|nr:MAG: methyltransferase [Candidatus Falkowbacteria bacterium]